MSSNDSFLVIGGSGFLGRAIVDMLLERGNQRVAVFDLKTDGNFDSRVQVYQGNILNEDELLSALNDSGTTCIIHTASPMPGAPAPSFWKVNVDGTRAVISAAVKAGVEKLIYTSSASTIFNGADIAGVDETTPFPKKHMDTYNETKAIAETIIVDANGHGGLKTAVLRPSGIFGPGDYQSIASYARLIDDGKTTMQLGDNTNLFDFLYVENAAYAFILAAEKLSGPVEENPVAGQVFIITNDDPWPFWNLARAVWKGLGHVPPKTTIIPRPVAMFIGLISEFWGWLTGKPALITRFRVTFACATRWFNISKAKTLLGYKPLYTMDEGVQKSVEWWKNEGSKRGY
ncbi:hypothetical protein OE88DRAFT_1715206 [Heliocybe sulcata]|uniref:3-beta hydroxysteroid dehydrogenase/isomerase domain-containing protein n=1 Tax=Heliocybe sulcata TaxID=5364 RepID=A0A5C3MKN2_9AGAM|nr:hypothetical protein OE88DRAFT_1715206 [Heliocybe sulcata]